jgi:hypothetical protein
VQIYQQAGRLAIMSPQGKRTYVDDKQRQQQISKLKKTLLSIVVNLSND